MGRSIESLPNNDAAEFGLIAIFRRRSLHISHPGLRGRAQANIVWYHRIPVPLARMGGQRRRIIRKTIAKRRAGTHPGRLAHHVGDHHRESTLLGSRRRIGSRSARIRRRYSLARLPGGRRSGLSNHSAGNQIPPGPERSGQRRYPLWLHYAFLLARRA